LRNRAFFAALPIGVFVTDADGRCIDANLAALNLLRLDHDAVVGQHLRTLLGAGIELQLAGVLTAPDTVSVDVLRLFPNEDRERVVEFSGALLASHQNDAIVYFLRDVTEEAALEQQLRQRALEDPLTGLPNRHALEEKIDLALKHIGRGASPAVLCLLDLDYFKEVNDSCGHAAGDDLLKRMADAFKQRVRVTDAIGRLGGDEFVVLLHSCPLRQAIHHVHELRERLLRLDFHWHGRPFRISLSAGLTVLTSRTPSVAHALAEADAACFQAKSAGRSQTRVFSGNLCVGTANISADADILETLKRALACKTISLGAQPLRHVKSAGSVAAVAELLLRIEDNQHNLIPPTQLLRIASRYGLDSELDRWIIRRASDWLIQLDPASRHCRFYVNITATSLTDHLFPEWIKKHVPTSVVPYLGLEIDEAHVMRHPQSAARLIRAAHAIGYGVAIDNVSGAIDAISLLSGLPITLLKLHPAFSRMTAAGDTTYIQAQALVRIAHQAGFAVAITHVETNEALSCVAHLAADFAQGVAISPVLPLIRASSTSHGEGAAPAGKPVLSDEMPESSQSAKIRAQQR
jgi:diguanylate cyclase (GGDEF)-like protein/PAS domain S-box-containing protein